MTKDQLVKLIVSSIKLDKTNNPNKIALNIINDLDYYGSIIYIKEEE